MAYTSTESLAKSTPLRAGVLFLTLLAIMPEAPALFWPPAGLALAVLLRSRPRSWPAYLLALFLAGTVTSLFFHRPLPTALSLGVAEALGPLLGALMIRRFAGASFDPARLRDLVVLVGSAIVSPIPSAVLAAVTSRHSMRTQWFAASLSEIVITPFLITWFSGRTKSLRRRDQTKEGVIIIVLVALVTWSVFGTNQWLFPFPCSKTDLIFPILMWAVLRFETHGATATTLILSSIAYYAARGDGSFGFIPLQSYLALSALSALALGAVMTERRQSTENLRKADSFLTSVLENIPDMIFVKSAKDLRIVRTNKAGEEFLGYPREYLIGKNTSELLTKQEADFSRTVDRGVIESGSVVEIPEETIHTVKGLRVLHTKKIVLNDHEGNPEYVLGISEDITEKKQAEEVRIKLIHEQKARIEAEKAVQLRDDFLSIASHELRTPLTPIRVYLHLAKREVDALGSEIPRAPLLQNAINGAEREFDRFLGLVENLLDVSRINAGSLIVERHESDLLELVRGVVNRFEPGLKKVGCELRLAISEDRFVGEWDSRRIEQVFVNLLGNAMKYGAGRPIEVTLFRDGDTAILKVRDYGIGIEKDGQERLFSKFERVAPLKHFGGFGLGLFISREIVQAHGGVIRVESELGEGATFIVELPIVSALPGQ